MTLSETLKKYWYIPFAIFGILFLSYFILFVMMVNEPSYGLIIYELGNSNQPSNAIMLTEEDFKVFPKLAPIIRDKSQKPSYIDNEGRNTYTVKYWEDEHYAFVSHFGNWGDLEYKGKHYRFLFMNVD
jgi:hypothetical protein